MDDSHSNPTYQESKALQVSGKVMVGAVIFLFLVIVLVLFLHLYSRWVWRRRAEGSHISRPRRRFVFAPGQDPVHVMHRGLESSVIRSLPVFIFHPDDFKDGLECSVCLCELSDGEKARLLPKCNHGFHVDCIDMWFQYHSTCPLCRNPVTLETPNSSTPQLPEIQLQRHDSTTGYSLESPNSPSNVLFRVPGPEEGPSSSALCSSCSCSSRVTMRQEALVIEIPQHLSKGFSSLSPSASGFAEEELKSPMTTRLRSLRMLLSREKRVIPCSPSSIDVEQGEGGIGQISKTASDS